MKRLNCAIYTRKSSEEGLEQGFNSLDAQREAAEAYIKSQRAEGWALLPTKYDDGGYSGGNMERPALQKLLADIDAGKVDVVVVYKIDRLTRSLPDFARIVECFDARGVSFVSVTQAFNTTSSMGRLTLNVLLSFAQFEREVTGERIRDKIAASKAKGMWMGGMLPLGFDLPAAGTRTLLVNDPEAEAVRHIFTRYLELGSVHQLAQELRTRGVFSKSWIAASGKQMGGQPFSRGALFHLLRNRLYLGQIVHKGEVYEGAHQAIVPHDLFDEVAKQLEAGRTRCARAGSGRVASARLAGRIFDAEGEPMSPTFSYGRGGRVYRYYVSASLQQGERASRSEVLRRISVSALEGIVERALAVTVFGVTLDNVLAVIVGRTGLQVKVATSKVLSARVSNDIQIQHASDGISVLTIRTELPLRGGRTQISAPRKAVRVDAILVAALRRAHAMLQSDGNGQPLIKTAPKSLYERRILKLAFLAPDIQEAIMSGTLPRDLNLERLVKMELPNNWSAQRLIFGMSI